MNKKLFWIGWVVLGLPGAGCQRLVEDDYSGCNLSNSCNPVATICEYQSPKRFADCDIRDGDPYEVCRPYVNCEMVSGTCQFIHKEGLDACRSCVLECEKQATPSKFRACAQQCKGYPFR